MQKLNSIYSKTYNFVYLRAKSILQREEDFLRACGRYGNCRFGLGTGHRSLGKFRQSGSVRRTRGKPCVAMVSARGIHRREGGMALRLFLLRKHGDVDGVDFAFSQRVEKSLQTQRCELRVLLYRVRTHPFHHGTPA